MATKAKEIQLHPNKFNRDRGFTLSQAMLSCSYNA